jgi:hypothetical protein
MLKLAGNQEADGNVVVNRTLATGWVRLFTAST